MSISFSSLFLSDVMKLIEDAEPLEFETQQLFEYTLPKVKTTVFQ